MTTHDQSNCGMKHDGAHPHDQMHRTERVDENATLELKEEELYARKYPVQVGEVLIRKEVVTEVRSIEVPVTRQEIVIERKPVERRPMDTVEFAGSPDRLEELLAQRLRDLPPGQAIRVPIVEDEVVVQTRPVVVEELAIGKRVVEETRRFEGEVKREVARVHTEGNVEPRTESRSTQG